jgi:hypothetical protein
MTKVHTHRTAKVIKQTLISAGVLLILIIGSGIAYVYFTGRSATPDNSQAAPKVTEEKTPFTNPPQPPEDAKVGASLEYISSPVKPGENTTMSVHTNPKASCTIAVAYNNIPVVDSGLIKKTADVYGSVAWTWTVSKDAPLGKWPIKVTCANAKNSAMVQGDLVIVK